VHLRVRFTVTVTVSGIVPETFHKENSLLILPSCAKHLVFYRPYRPIKLCRATKCGLPIAVRTNIVLNVRGIIRGRDRLNDTVRHAVRTPIRLWKTAEMIVLGHILFGLGSLACFVGEIKMLTLAYRRGPGWFLSCIFLAPICWLALLAVDCKLAIKPFVLACAGLIAIGIGGSLAGIEFG